MADESLDHWLKKVSGEPNAVPIEEPRRPIDVLMGLQAQNHTIIRQNERIMALLDEIARSSRRTAAHTFWIALPVWLWIAAVSLLIGLFLSGAILHSMR